MDRDKLIEKLKLQFAEILKDESKLNELRDYFNHLITNEDTISEPAEDYAIETATTSTSINKGLIPDWYHEELLERKKQFLNNPEDAISLFDFKSKVKAKYGF